MNGKRWPFQNHWKIVMIYHITPNELRNMYCTEVYLYTKSASAQKITSLIWWRCTLLDKGFCCRLPRTYIYILFVRMLSVVMPLQGTRYIAGIVAMCATERLGVKRENVRMFSWPLQDTGLSCNVLIPRNHFWFRHLPRRPSKVRYKWKLQLNIT